LLSQTYGLIPPSLVSIPDNNDDEDEDDENKNDDEEDSDYNRSIPHNSSAIVLPIE
jgi:hypothetical protein